MSEKEQAKKIIDSLPEYKMSRILMFLKVVQFDDEIEDDQYCEKLAEDYFNSTEEHEFITLEEFANQEGINLTVF